MKYIVSRTHIETEYLEGIEAGSRQEAVDRAREYPGENWELSPHDGYIDYYDYTAQEED